MAEGRPSHPLWSDIGRLSCQEVIRAGLRIGHEVCVSQCGLECLAQRDLITVIISGESVNAGEHLRRADVHGDALNLSLPGSQCSCIEMEGILIVLFSRFERRQVSMPGRRQRQSHLKQPPPHHIPGRSPFVSLAGSLPGAKLLLCHSTGGRP